MWRRNFVGFWLALLLGLAPLFAQVAKASGLQTDYETLMPQWDVVWYPLAKPGVFGPHAIGRSKWPLEFKKDWGFGPVYSVYENRIGFKAYTTIYVPFDFEVGFRFVATARNGLALYIDGKEVFNYYAVFDDVNVDRWYTLSPGLHRLELHYQHWTGEAYVNFEIGVETDASLWFSIVLERRLKDLVKQVELLQQRIHALEEALGEISSQLEQVGLLKQRIEALEEALAQLKEEEQDATE